MIDEIDKQILNLLRDNARISNAEIAKRIEKAPSAVLERIRKLEKKGIIEGYETRINSKTLGLNLKTIVLIKTDENVGSMGLGDQLAKIDEVQEVLCMAGEYSYLCKVNVKDTDDQAKFLVKLGAIPGVVDSITTLVLKSIKEELSVKI
ncbi:MAG: Lrp/AsnC family transcriptional regulator [Rhodothermaceae bacterium]